MKTVFLVSCILFSVVSLQAKDYNILSYGAIADGRTLNTSAIQSAIDIAHLDGGGKVIIPKGVFLSGTIRLKSNVTIYLEKKAILLGSTNPAHYIKIARWKGLVMADHANNIGVSGSGTIDGQGSKLALHIDSLFYAGEIDSAQYNFVEKRPKWYLRPQVIEFVNCNKVNVMGVTLKNSACWVQTYDRCKDVTIDKVKVDSDAYWNNDGIDIVDCIDVSITNCYINSADDGICIKSDNRGAIEYSENIYIANCTVRSSASAVKFGTSSYNNIRNVIIRDIKVFDTYRSAIAIESMQGGIIENVLVENIDAKNTGNAIFLRTGQIRSATKNGILKNITIRNVKVTVPFEHPDYNYAIRGPELPFFHNVFPSSISGNPGNSIKDVTLENITIIYPGRGNEAYASMPIYRLNDVPELTRSYPEFSMFGELPAWGFYIRHVDGLKMNNVKIKIKNPDYRPAIVLDDAKNVTFRALKIYGDKKKNLIIKRNSKEVRIVK